MHSSANQQCQSTFCNSLYYKNIFYIKLGVKDGGYPQNKRQVPAYSIYSIETAGSLGKDDTLCTK